MSDPYDAWRHNLQRSNPKAKTAAHGEHHYRCTCHEGREQWSGWITNRVYLWASRQAVEQSAKTVDFLREHPDAYRCYSSDEEHWILRCFCHREWVFRVVPVIEIDPEQLEKFERNREVVEERWRQASQFSWD